MQVQIILSILGKFNLPIKIALTVRTKRLISLLVILPFIETIKCMEINLNVSIIPR